MRDKRDKRDPVEFVLEENPNLAWDDIHDVRELAELLGAMVEDLEETLRRAEGHIASLKKENDDLKAENHKLDKRNVELLKKLYYANGSNKLEELEK